MEKTIHSREYSMFLKMLRAARRQADITQADVSRQLGRTQSFISKCERGERRLDIIEARAFCRVLGVDFIQFVKALESSLGRPKGGSGR